MPVRRSVVNLADATYTTSTARAITKYGLFRGGVSWVAREDGCLQLILRARGEQYLGVSVTLIGISATADGIVSDFATLDLISLGQLLNQWGTDLRVAHNYQLCVRTFLIEAVDRIRNIHRPRLD